MKCSFCKIELKNTSEFVQGVWHMFEQDGHFELTTINADTFYCVPCFNNQDDFRGYFDQNSLKHSEDCPLIKLRIPCEKCNYPQSEARYSSVENYIFHNTTPRWYDKGKS